MQFRYSKRKMVKLFANSGDPGQMPHSVASDLDLQCLSFTFLGVSRLQWVRVPITTVADDILKYFLFNFS